jgi:parallel beta-helix repeat protein
MKKSYLLFISVFLLTLALPAIAFPATLCVNPGGTGNCYPTIQGAVNAAAPFDVIQVYEGVYFENVYIPVGTHSIIIGGVKVTTSRVKGVGTTIVPADPTKVIVDAYPLGGVASGPGFWLDGAGNVTIRNLTVRNAHTAGPSGANIYSTGAFTMIDNVHAVSGDRQGVYIIGDDATVRYSNISGNDYRGIAIDGDRATVEYNTIWNNRYQAVDIGSHDATIVGNDIRQVEDSNCVEVTDGDNVVIADNLIAGCGSHGIYVTNGTNALISRNIITSLSQDGINLSGMTNSMITWNDIQGCDDEGIESYTGGAGNNTFSNNTVVDTSDECYDITENNPTVTGNTGMYAFDYPVFDIDCPGACIGGTISNNYASYATDDSPGFDLDVSNMTISDNTSEHNSEEGFEIDGNNNTISGNTAIYNGTQQTFEEGIDVEGNGNFVSNNLCERNWGRGFHIGGDNTVTGNTSSNNYRTGIELGWTSGGTLTLNGNTVTNNHGEGIANNAGPTVVITNNTSTGNRLDVCNDGTINTFTGNTFVTGGPGTGCDLD